MPAVMKSSGLKPIEAQNARSSSACVLYLAITVIQAMPNPKNSRAIGSEIFQYHALKVIHFSPSTNLYFLRPSASPIRLANSYLRHVPTLVDYQCRHTGTVSQT